MLKYGVLVLLVVIIGVAGFGLAIEFAIELSGLMYGFLKAGFILGFLWAIDKFILTDFDTIEEVRNGNITYGIVFGSIAIATALCIAGA